MVALLAVNEHLGQPDIVPLVTSLKSKQLRHRLKTLLNILACDLDEEMPVAGQLPDSGAKKYVMFGVGNLHSDDQIWIANIVPYGMVIHCPCLNPPVVSSVSLGETERIFKPVEFWVAGSSQLTENIGVTVEESEKLRFSVGNLNVKNFSRFYVSPSSSLSKGSEEVSVGPFFY
jgi:hypothetical protein